MAVAPWFDGNVRLVGSFVSKEMPMNTTTQIPSRKNGIVGAIGVLILLIGTATGNAYAMLAMSVVALAVFATFFRPGWSRKLRIAIAVIGVIAFVTAVAIATMM
jgi:FtsH-binding integral membrane protein